MIQAIDTRLSDPARPDAAARPGRWRWLRDGVVATLPAWLVAHAIVIAVSWHINPQHPLAKLFMWDTRWYRMIAAYGYDRVGVLVHFFPLTPYTAGAVGQATRLNPTFALFGFCWLASLVFGALVHRVTVRETGDRRAARRAAWLTQLAAGAYALVLGYTEPLAGVLAAGYFLAIRSYPDRKPRPWLAVALGLLSGLARPTGFVLAVPGVIEGVRQVRAEGRHAAVAVKAALAAVAPVVGLFSFLVYSKIRFHSGLLPLRQQTVKGNRGHLVNDPVHAFRTVSHLHWHGHQVANMCALLILLALVLLPLVWRRLPVSYLAWTVPMFILGISSHNFTSLPRYVGALFPILIVVATVSRRWWQEAFVIAAGAGLLLWTTHVALTGYLVA